MSHSVSSTDAAAHTYDSAETRRNAAQPLGFPPAEMSPPVEPMARPTPLPKRPKGRWFVGIILLGVCGVVAYSVWSAYFRYQAYGTITGHLIQVSAPWDGDLRYLAVREGDMVRQEQLLFVVDNIELRHRHAQLNNDLRVAQANLEAETAKLKWQSAFGLDQTQGTMTTYFQAWGNLLREQARLDELRTELRRSEILWATRSISQQELQQYQFAVQGHEHLVAKLRESLVELKERAEQAEELLKEKNKLSTGLEQTGYQQLLPFFSRIEALEAERARIQELLDQGQVRAPTNGLVVKTQHFVGERCQKGEPILTLLEEGSLEVVLYLPQDASTLLAPGDEVELVLEPYPEPLSCRVKKLGDQFEPAPEHLKRHYREGQRLLPVKLEPSREVKQWMALRVGGVVKLPYFRPDIIRAERD
ncbi:MAG: HlyD family secretion protein [Gemmataceae bacterium]